MIFEVIFCSRNKGFHKMTSVQCSFQRVIEKALKDGVLYQDIEKICSTRCDALHAKSGRKTLIMSTLVLVLALVLCYFSLEIFTNDVMEMIADAKVAVLEMDCAADHSELSNEFTRPAFDCSLCSKLDSIPIESHLSKDRFEKLYAFTGLPVVIKKGAINWTAHDTYSVRFFRDIYTARKGSFKRLDDECQFMPYYTKWETLEEALMMSDEMAALKEDNWYIGWSNCLEDIEIELRKHYDKPSFLPDAGATVHMDWIFMGGSGIGAPIHLDSVGRPSWQAQIRGKKTWTLTPSPECDGICKPMSVVMNSSDIIVLDTDRWYHSTYIHPGEISITIGSEYD